MFEGLNLYFYKHSVQKFFNINLSAQIKSHFKIKSSKNKLL